MSRRDRRHSGSAGFAVLEVLVAFVIAVIGLAMAFGAIQTQGWLLADASRARYATAWADSTLAALGVAVPLAAGASDGVLASGHRWRLTVTPYLPAAAEPPPPAQWYRADLVVAWPSWSGERSLHVETLQRAMAATPPPQ